MAKTADMQTHYGLQSWQWVFNTEKWLVQLL